MTPSIAVPPVSPQYEADRLAALQSLNLLDTPESESFDRITRLASSLFGAPICAMSLTDRSRQWFKSYHGVPHREIPRDGAPCAEVTDTREALCIPDLLDHGRYRDCLLARAGIRFYAGTPLTTRQGYTLGSFCVLDTKPRKLTMEQMAQLRDMAQMVMSQVELQHEFGRIDPLTRLPNRYQLAADLEELVPSSDVARVLVLIEIADLRHVNESASVLGSNYLEELLCSCAQRIRAALRRDAMLYQVGAAAFALVLDDGQERWHEVVDVVSEAVRAPIDVGGGVVSVTAAYGVTPIDSREIGASELLRRATGALHEARQNDLRFAVYDESSNAAHTRRFAILRCLQESLAREEHFSLVFQPRVCAETGRCLGAEALLRWDHPELGKVTPGEFIPLIEQTSLAGAMTRWVLSAAFAQVRTWKAAGASLRLSVNISARNLEEPFFADQVAAAMAVYGVTGGDVELEFTESAVIRHEARVLEQLRQLRELGLELAIDDFGAGYSSPSYLHKLPAQTVKLDRSFIQSIGCDKRWAVLVEAMIRMSHDLGYRVVAEGVETREALTMVQELRCEEIQGYFVARPLTVQAFDEFVLRRTGEAVLALTKLRGSAESRTRTSVA